MHFQHKEPQVVIDIFKEQDPEYFYGPECLDYFAWPMMFGSTSGPRGGIGGQAISHFTVEAYVSNGSGPTVFICAGMYYFDKDRFEFMKRVPNWKKLPE